MRNHLIAAVVAALAGPAFSSVVNLAPSAATLGTSPSVTLNSGSLAGLTDGRSWAWDIFNSGPGRTGISTPPANLQPYLTWSSPQYIASVRVWSETNWMYPNFSRLVVDTLKPGGNATVESDWVQRVDTGTINSFYRDLSLGGLRLTQGIRVRAFTTSLTSSQGLNTYTDHRVGIGEVAAFGQVSTTLVSSRLTDVRVLPTSATASSQQWIDRPPSQTFDNVWQDNYWRSTNDASNPGTDYLLNFNYATGRTINAYSLTFNGANVAATSWEIFADTGAGLQLVGSYSLTGNRKMYYFDLPTLTNVTQFQLRVPESAATAGISIAEMETFLTAVPEPASLSLLVLGGVALSRRRR